MQGWGQQNTENSSAQGPEELGLALYKHRRQGKAWRRGVYGQVFIFHMFLWRLSGEWTQGTSKPGEKSGSGYTYSRQKMIRFWWGGNAAGMCVWDTNGQDCWLNVRVWGAGELFRITCRFPAWGVRVDAKGRWTSWNDDFGVRLYRLFFRGLAYHMEISCQPLFSYI